MFGLFGAFNPAFYARVARQKAGRSIGFLAVFVLIISTALSVKYTAALLKALDAARLWADTGFASFAAELPALEIRNGALVQPQQPYRKELREGFWFAIEPDSRAAALLLEENASVILLTGNTLVAKDTRSPGMVEQKTYELSRVKHLRVAPAPEVILLSWEQNSVEVTPASIKRWISAAVFFVFPAVLLFVFGLYAFTKPLQALFFSLFALIINAAYKTTLTYAQLFSISVYAMVPSACAAVLLELSGIRLGFFWFLYTAFYVLFLVLGIQAAHEAFVQHNAAA